ncbi:MAG: J domain-containing protein [Pirellulaceae bacterium]|nr:J domain-containing protein [Pirellulaceae bacterium]
MNPYKILGVSKDATLAEIKKAYREKCIKHHPDRGGDQWAFEQITQAFEYLRDQAIEKSHDIPPQSKKESSKPSPKPKSNNSNETPKPQSSPNKPKQQQKSDDVVPQIVIKKKKFSPRRVSKKNSAWITIVGILLGIPSAIVATWLILKYYHPFFKANIAKETNSVSEFESFNRRTEDSVQTQSSRTSKRNSSPKPSSPQPRSPQTKTPQKQTDIRNEVIQNEDLQRSSNQSLGGEAPARNMSQIENEFDLKSEPQVNRSQVYDSSGFASENADNAESEDSESTDPQELDGLEIIKNYLQFLDGLKVDTSGKTDIQAKAEIEVLHKIAEKELPKKTINLSFPVKNVKDLQRGQYAIGFILNPQESQFWDSFQTSDDFIRYRLSESEAKKIDSDWKVEFRGKLKLEVYSDKIYRAKNEFVQIQRKGNWIAFRSPFYLTGTEKFAKPYILIIEKPQVKLVRPK